MDRLTTSTVLIGLVLALGVVVAVGVVGASFVAEAIDLADNDSSDTDTEFQWGTVTYEADSETGETHVEVVVEDAADVSVSTSTAPDGVDGHSDELTDAETETFPWGSVTYATDPDTGESHVDVIVDAEQDVSLSVTTASDDGSESTSTSVVQTGGASGDDGEATSVNVSQSTNSSSEDDEVSLDLDLDVDD